jgi:hypothetical protein
MAHADASRPALLPRRRHRQGWAGVHEASVAASLLVALAVAGGVFSLAVALVGRGWRLKP